jgi:hypothetical protein
MYVCMYVCMCVCVCMYVCMYMCVRVCMYVCMCIYVHWRARARVCMVLLVKIQVMYKLYCCISQLTYSVMWTGQLTTGSHKAVNHPPTSHLTLIMTLRKLITHNSSTVCCTQIRYVNAVPFLPVCFHSYNMKFWNKCPPQLWLHRTNENSDIYKPEIQVKCSTYSVHKIIWSFVVQQFWWCLKMDTTIYCTLLQLSVNRK